MTWSEKFPPPADPMPAMPDPNDLTKQRELRAYNTWAKANRSAIAAKALDELTAMELTEMSPADRIAFVVGTAFLDGSLEPGLLGGVF